MTILSNQKIYSLQEIFGDFLWGRHMAIMLRDRILQDHPTQAIADLSGVRVVTRAFADEFLLVKQFLASEKIRFIWENAESGVQPMLQLCARKSNRTPTQL